MPEEDPTELLHSDVHLQEMKKTFQCSINIQYHFKTCKIIMGKLYKTK